MGIDSFFGREFFLLRHGRVFQEKTRHHNDDALRGVFEHGYLMRGTKERRPVSAMEAVARANPMATMRLFLFLAISLVSMLSMPTGAGQRIHFRDFLHWIATGGRCQGFGRHARSEGARRFRHVGRRRLARPLNCTYHANDDGHLQKRWPPSLRLFISLKESGRLRHFIRRLLRGGLAQMR